MDKMECQEYLAQGKVLLGQEQYEDALIMLEKAEQADRMEIEVYLAKGLCHANLDQLDKAKKEFEKALKLNRNHGGAMFHIGNILMLQNEKAAAIEMYNSAIANGYDDSQIFFTLGLYL